MLMACYEERILMINFRERGTNGAQRTQAILTSPRVRLRPISMTSFAMTFGMKPLALAIGEGAEQRTDGACGDRRVDHVDVADVVLVPVFYTLLDI